MWLPKAPAGWRWIVFDDGRVAFLAPAEYAMHREADETVAVHPKGNDSGITLRFSLHPKLLLKSMPTDVAEQFVTYHANANGLTLTRLHDRVFLTESREDDWPDRRVLMHYWQVGAGRILVVCSATVGGKTASQPPCVKRWRRCLRFYKASDSHDAHPSAFVCLVYFVVNNPIPRLKIPLGQSPSPCHFIRGETAF